MKQIKIAIGAALAARKAVLGQVHAGWPPSNATFPCTAFYQVAGNATTIGGILANSDELYSVDCLAKTMTATEDMAAAADEAMNSLPYAVSREGNLDLYEEEAKIFHKVLRYRIKSKGGI